MLLYLFYRLGLITAVGFRSPWARHMSWYFRGYSLEQASEIWDWVVSEFIQDQWREDILHIHKQHKDSGDVVFLVSGGPLGLLNRIKEEIGADYAVGTKHELLDGIYTGRAEGQACQGENKAIFTNQLITELGLEIDLKQSHAYADSASDLHLLEMVANPIAVYPDSELLSIAEKRGWEIIPG
ncbi:MAG: HAD-IB family hydrolase [Chloroflexi bacterium]|nr:HAD-IB family hydrolase [Chloroflexota bacterium]